MSGSFGAPGRLATRTMITAYSVPSGRWRKVRSSRVTCSRGSKATPSGRPTSAPRSRPQKAVVSAAATIEAAGDEPAQ